MNARLKSGAKLEDIEAGLIRYAKYIEGTGKANTEYVMRMVTFFGPDEHYLESWAFTEPVKRMKLPGADADLVPFAEKKGLSKPRVGESSYDYRRRLQREIGE